MVLCILDGWGHRAERDNNAIAMADTPTWDRWMAAHPDGQPHALVETSGRDVGLPDGQMGNSEVGHMNIGAGRVVLQDLPQIDAAIADGTLSVRPALTEFIATLRDGGGTCHLLGLVSPGGVHSHQDHMVALAKDISAASIPVRIHAFLDGRDTPPQSARGFMEQFLNAIGGFADTVVATVSGRYYAMDRDNRWDRVQRAYAAIVDGDGDGGSSTLEIIDHAYNAGVTDEFVEPGVVDGYSGMTNDDGLIMANFRADRVRQILSALLERDFDGFERARQLELSAALGMADYSTGLSKRMTTLFPAAAPEQTIGHVIADNKLTQLRIAETEKYAHVTFFLNGGTENEFAGEQRCLIPSPKVATYDLVPAMSAVEVTDQLVDAVQSETFDFIVVNYANGDMVGHTGKLSAAIHAAKTVDECLARLETAVCEVGGTLLVTADHGNCELMVDPENGGAHTAHTIGVVPVVLINGPAGVNSLRDGRLADIAPTILDLMKLDQPEAMTGESLLDRSAAAPRRAAE